MATILIDEERCTGCGTCAAVCPARLIAPAGEGRAPAVDPARAPFCIECGHCETYCPVRAIALDLPEERSAAGPEDWEIEPGRLGRYLQARRSVRQYTAEPVPRETIEAILDLARYAPSGGNRQPVEWLVVHDPAEVRRLAGLVVDWMRHELAAPDPMMPPSVLAPLVAAWDRGADPICRGAPHLLVAHVPADGGSGFVDGIIALTHADLAAPSFGVGTCWAGFLAIAAARWEPLRAALALPPGRAFAFALLFGRPRFRPHGIPRRAPLRVEWR